MPAGWVRQWARGLASEKNVLLSPHTVYDLPTPRARAAARTVEEAEALPSGVRIHFLASGVEFVDENEEGRVKGDFDGAIDLKIRGY